MSTSDVTLATKSGSQDAPRPKRAQVSKACQRCKRLQKGCSEFRPCQRCVKAGLEDDCVRGLSSRRSFRGHDQDVSWSFTHLPASPHSVTHALPGIFQRRLGLLPSRLVDRCCERFFDQLFPTIPILTPEYVSRLRARDHDGASEAHCVIVAMCGMVLLQVEKPDSVVLGGDIHDTNAVYGKLVFEEALTAHHSLSRVSTPTFEYVLASFFLYACHAALFHHSQAFLYLREATTLFLLLKIDDNNATSKLLADRLFWVLLVSERSHAIRYRRPTTLHITSTSPVYDDDQTLVGLWSLVQLFRPLDTTFIALLNQEETVFRPTAASLEAVEEAVNSAIRDSFNLHDTQKANLRITQIWLRVIIWQVRLRLGFLSEGFVADSLTFHYPLAVANELTISVKDMPMDSIKIHGVGLTEKLFDVACAVVDVLARVPLGGSYQQNSAATSEDNLRHLYHLISQLPGGSDVYISLLDKHIEQTLPQFTLG